MKELEEEVGLTGREVESGEQCPFRNIGGGKIQEEPDAHIEQGN